MAKRGCRGTVILVGYTLLGPASGGLHARETTAIAGGTLDPITVTTTRTSQGRPLASIPGSVTVIDRETLDRQTRTTHDLGEVLSNVVPGLGPSSQATTNFGQQMRGRARRGDELQPESLRTARGGVVRRRR